MRQNTLDRLLRDLGTLFRVCRLYPAGNEQVERAAGKAAEGLVKWGRPLRIALLGDDTIVEDQSFGPAPTHCAPLLRALRQSGCESVRIDPTASPRELAAWAKYVASDKSGVYESETIVTGALDLQARNRADGAERLARAAAGYLAFVPQAEEALSDLASQKPEGVVHAREIVRAIAAYVAAGEDLLEPIRELKDHDEYTFTHALNVCVLSSALSRALGARDEFLDVLGLAALCHDLGKQEIPDKILNKRGRLDPEERRIMDDHPRRGAELLLRFPESSPIHPLLPVVAYQHHMGADRSGYPRIPVCEKPHPASLLVAVADVFDALRTARPYRGAWTNERACTILLEESAAGKLYGAYVSAFFGLLQVVVPGKRVRLSDESEGIVLEPGTSDPLKPTVETTGGCVLDLASAGAPRLVALGE